MRRRSCAKRSGTCDERVAWSAAARARSGPRRRLARAVDRAAAAVGRRGDPRRRASRGRVASTRSGRRRHARGSARAVALVVGLAAAATIGAIAFGVVQLAPFGTAHDPMRATDMPSAERAARPADVLAPMIAEETALTKPQGASTAPAGYARTEAPAREEAQAARAPESAPAAKAGAAPTPPPAGTRSGPKHQRSHLPNVMLHQPPKRRDRSPWPRRRFRPHRPQACLPRSRRTSQPQRWLPRPSPSVPRN